jgi:diacylglycerol kinase (ATP)
MVAEQILIAANPKSGSSSRKELVGQLRDALIDGGFSVQICESLDDIQQLASQFRAANQLRCVISAGGDGTVAAVANRIAADIPLLIFPLGTENLLSKHFGLNTDIADVRAKVANYRTITMDVGAANGKMFLVMASCGFDATVVDRMHAIRKGHINRFSYAWPILGALREYRFPMLQTRSDQQQESATSLPETHSSAWLFVFNVPRYAARLQFCPQADPIDGLLDICAFKRPGVLSGMRYVTNLWFGNHQRLEDFKHWRTSGLTIHCDESEIVPYQLDGDPGGILPLRIDVLPKRLRLVV